MKLHGAFRKVANETKSRKKMELQMSAVWNLNTLVLYVIDCQYYLTRDKKPEKNIEAVKLPDTSIIFSNVKLLWKMYFGTDR